MKIKKLQTYFEGADISKMSQKIEVSSMTELFTYCNDKKQLGFDTETTGLDPFQSQVIMMQIGDENTQFVVDTRGVKKEELLPIFQLLENNEIEKVLQNAKFDYKMMYANYKVRISNIQDTLLQERVLHCGKFNYGYGMADMAQRYMGFRPDKEVRERFLHIKERDFYDDEVIYGALDVWIPIVISRYQQPEIEKFKLQNCVKLENKFCEVLADMELSGVYLDSKLWEKTYEENLSNYNACHKALEDYVLASPKLKQFWDKQLDMFSETRKTSIMWTSSAQVIPLFKAIGIPTTVLEKDKEKISKKQKELVTVATALGQEDIEIPSEFWKDSIEARHLTKYVDKYPIVPLYIAFKEAQIAVTTFGLKFLENINPITGRIHSDFMQIMNTGRLASNNPNMQNIPAEHRFRKCFIAGPGKKLVVSDYSSQESRVLADKANESAMIDFFVNGGGDMHSYTAEKMFRIPAAEIKAKHPELRQLAKVLNFGIALNSMRPVVVRLLE